MSITTTANGPLVSFIERAAKDPEFDIAKFGELLRMQRDVERDQQRRAFNAAMSTAQSEMLPIVRDATNSHLHNKYATLEAIDSGIRPVYTQHGFSVRYGSAPCPAEGSIRITCTVAHSDGYYEEHYLDSPLGNAGALGGRTATTSVQAVGSAITYLRRYLLVMVFNVVMINEEGGDDDDGEGTREKTTDTSRRTAALNTTRGSRITDTTTTHNETGRTKTFGEVATAIELALKDAPHKPAADAILTGDTMRKLEQHAKGAGLQRLNDIKAWNAARWRDVAPAQPVTPPDDDGWPGGELREVEIVGANKLAG